MNTFRARKTEYKGIVFDSKSEAVFARTLDLAGHYWVYHPSPHCGHEWDFLVFPNILEIKHRMLEVGGRRYYGPSSQIVGFRDPMLIEYKPKMPTMSYVENLTNRMRANPIESVLVWGNPWDGPAKKCDVNVVCCYYVYPIFSRYAKYGWGDFAPLADHSEDAPKSHRHPIRDFLGITEQMAQEAKCYRFDLVGGGQ